MFGIEMHNFLPLLRVTIMKDPNPVVTVIANFLGLIMNFIFNFVYSFTDSNSLGFTIILLTIIVRIIMIPLAMHSQKSMFAMQKLQPEINKINKKYGDSKDPEVQKKKTIETQALYSKHKVNPLSGCLPMFIQLPLFWALSQVMRNSYMYINVLGDMYNKIASEILNSPTYTNYVVPFVLNTRVSQKTADAIAQGTADPSTLPDVSQMSYMLKLLNSLFLNEWQGFLSNFPQITDLYNQKTAIEMFFGLNLIDKAGLTWPGIIIPILSALTTFGSSWIMNKQQPAKDEQAKMMQKTMLIVMPIMMGFMTISFPAGVGLYWVTSNAFQLVQQPLIMKYFKYKEAKIEANVDVIDEVKNVNQKDKNNKKKK